MGFSLAIHGTLRFADAAHLERGLDAFFAAAPADDFFVDLDAFRCDDLALSVAVDEASYRARAEMMRGKLAALASHAATGAITCDGQPVEAAGAPHEPHARHHRYDAYFAARAGDAARLRELVAMGVKLDGRYGQFDTTLLHLAAQARSIESIEVLVAAGLDVDARTTYGSTPLFATTLEVTRALLAAGADPNAYGAILSAACTAPGGVVETLLAAGAIPQADDHELARTCAALGQLGRLRAFVERNPAFGATLAKPHVMRSAISSRDPVLLDYLLEHGAQLPDDFLQQAVHWGAFDLVVAALRGPEGVERCGPSNRDTDAMCRAAFHGRLDIMELLAQRGVPLHPATPGKTTPFLEAARSGKADVLEWLLARGVPYNEDAAYYASSAAALMVFIRRGFDPDDEGLREDWTQTEGDAFRRLLGEWQVGR